MPDWSKKFKAEYDDIRTRISNADNFSEDWRPLILRLQKLCDDSGFDAAQASALADLRKAVTWGEKGVIGHKTVTEDVGILRAVGDSDADGGAVEARKRLRAAALKLLRHVYLINKSGNRKAWVVSLPTELQAWPTDDFHARATTREAARTLLRGQSEIFSAEARKHLAQATRHGLAWCQRTLIVLALAAKAAEGKGGGAKSVDALNLVKRWFADPATTLPDLQTYIATLQAGFKNVVKLLNRGQMILTDWVPLRTATTQAEIKFLNSEAFTFSSHGEGLDVVYIERSFFTNHPGNVLSGLKNWTRILVHELTHLECGTTDVNIGNARYAWYGIGPHAGYPGSACIRNADNWAFFSADCAGQLTDSERTKALKII